MIQHAWSVVCTKSITDQKTNNISLFEVLEKLTFDVTEEALKNIKDKKPEQNVLFNYPFELVSLWARTDVQNEAPIDTKIELIDPDGSLVEANNFRIVIPEGKLRLRVNIQMPGVPVKKAGIYWYKISFKEEGKRDYRPGAEVPLEIQLNFPKVEKR